jgi:hypothetical protein
MQRLKPVSPIGEDGGTWVASARIVPSPVRCDSAHPLKTPEGLVVEVDGQRRRARRPKRKREKETRLENVGQMEAGMEFK